ncbi:DUF3397 domain-containing protein [Metabacillus iocasae]|uniref:Membrane protein n=1 Tax=Priestia iocasae TaxID=2291674 RepID=A0ABS2QTC5_9BACI|nr:DUF3397 domain-containing protein [Metabacillus iocasae]MBM7701764.1 putative membrane protein [Metabacillus iocasae]
MMGNIIASIFATFVTVPLLAFLFSYMVLRKVTKNKKKSFHVATYIMTFFLILSAHYLLNVIAGASYGWVIALILLAMGMLTTFLHWKVKKDIHLPKVLKGFWRANLLLFSFVYMGLMICGIVLRISSL